MTAAVASPSGSTPVAIPLEGAPEAAAAPSPTLAPHPDQVVAPPPGGVSAAPGQQPQGPVIDAPGTNESSDGEEGIFGTILSMAGQLFNHPFFQVALTPFAAFPNEIGMWVSGLAAIVWIGQAVAKLMDPNHAPETEGFARLGTVLPELAAGLAFGLGVLIPGAGAFGGLIGIVAATMNQRENQRQENRDRMENERAEAAAADEEAEAAAVPSPAGTPAPEVPPSFDPSDLAEADAALWQELQAQTRSALADTEQAAEWRAGIERLSAQREESEENRAVYDRALAALDTQMAEIAASGLGGTVVPESVLDAAIAEVLPVDVEAAQARTLVEQLAVGDDFYVPSAEEFGPFYSGTEDADTQRQVYATLLETPGISEELRLRLTLRRALLGPEVG